MLDGHTCPQCGQVDDEPYLAGQDEAGTASVTDVVICQTCGFEFVVEANQVVAVDYSSRCTSDNHMWHTFKLWASVEVTKCLRCNETKPREQK